MRDGNFISPAQARHAVESDILFLVELAKEKYTDYTLEQAETWARAVLKMRNVAIFVCGESVACVAWQLEFWRPTERVADVLPMFGRTNSHDPWAQYKVLKAACQWAASQGCYAIRFGASIGAKAKRHEGVDLFKPFARRLGAKPFGITYIVELR